MTTGSDVITIVRDLLQDTVTDAYRYSDASLYRAMNVGLQEMRRLRPDVYFDGKTIRPVPVITADNIDDTLPLNDLFVHALTFFITGFAELREDQFTSDGRAATMLAQARNMLVGA